VTSWCAALEELKIDFVLLVLNAVSDDSTEACLNKFSGRPNIRIVSKTNSGHGPTILVGYNVAVSVAK